MNWLARSGLSLVSGRDTFRTRLAVGFPASFLGLLVVCAGLASRPATSPPAPPPTEEVGQNDQTELVPQTYVEGDLIVMPVAFPDGTTAELLYPPSLGLAAMRIQFYESAAGPAEVGRDFPIFYGRVSDVIGGFGQTELLGEYPDGRGGTVGFWRTPDVDYLAFQFGSWTVLVYDYQDSAARMSEEQRSLWATHLRGHETSDGWMILEANPPLRLTPAGEHAGPN